MPLAATHFVGTDELGLHVNGPLVGDHFIENARHVHVYGNDAEDRLGWCGYRDKFLSDRRI